MTTYFVRQSEAPFFTDKIGKDVDFSEQLMLLDNPPASNFRITKSTIRKNGYARLHSHEWEHAYFFVSGKARVGVGSEEQEVAKGDLVYVPANVPHSLKNIGDGPLEVLAVVGPDSKRGYGIEEKRK